MNLEGEQHHVKMKVEIRMLFLQAKEPRRLLVRPSDIRRHPATEAPLRPWREQPSHHLDLDSCLQGLCCSEPPAGSTLSRQSQKQRTRSVMFEYWTT